MRKMLLILICIILLSACGMTNTGVNDSKDWSAGNCDSQNYGSVRDMAYCKDGIFAKDISCDNRIIYIDTNTAKSATLCANPGCNHDGTDCNACFTSIEGIYYYDNSVYVIDVDTGEEAVISLYKVSRDGSTKEKVTDLFELEKESFSMSIQAVLHRGYIYIALNWDEDDSSATQKRTQTLYRIPLSGGNKEKLCTIEGYWPEYSILCAEENNVFFSACWCDDAGYEQYIIEDYRYDIVDNELEKLDKPDGKNFIGHYDKTNYYINSDCNRNGLIFYSADEDGDNLSPLNSQDDMEFRTYYQDDKYIYAVHEDPMGGSNITVILDNNGNVVNKINCEPHFSNKDTIVSVDYSSEPAYILYDIKTAKETKVATTHR